MATYRVAKWGSDSNDGSTTALAKLTIANAATSATTNGDIIEIIDEGRYVESAIAIGAYGVTVLNTASSLGRPQLAQGGGQYNAFTVGSYTDFKVYGLEIGGYSDSSSGYVLSIAAAGTQGLHISGCFIHDSTKLANTHMAGTEAKPSKIEQTIMFFEPATKYAISITGWCEITNCLLTSSNTSGDWPLVYDYYGNGTASFSTFINRGATTESTIRIAKAINCIVSSSDGKGIASNDHTYNAVCVSGDHWMNSAGTSGTFGTGDLYGLTSAQIGFVDGDSIGQTSAIAEAYKLVAERSLLIGAGTTYDSIAVDITGTIRPQDSTFDIGAFEFVSSDPTWGEYATQPSRNRQSNFILNTYTNLASNQRFSYSDNPGQAPFSLGTKGPSTLRGRSKAYKTTK